MHPGNVKGKEREPRPAAAGTPASGRKALAPALTSVAQPPGSPFLRLASAVIVYNTGVFIYLFYYFLITF